MLSAMVGSIWSQTKYSNAGKENAFRIMTIHKAKGLSFDAVVMPFATGH